MNANLVLVLAFGLAAVVGWLTACAQLADMHPGREILKSACRAVVGAGIAILRGGFHAFDMEAFRRGFRPFVRATTAGLIFATAPAAVGELAIAHEVGTFGVALCVSLALATATATPCPWLRYVFLGDRRRAQRSFRGRDQRVE